MVSGLAGRYRKQHRNLVPAPTSSASRYNTSRKESKQRTKPQNSQNVLPSGISTVRVARRVFIVLLLSYPIFDITKLWLFSLGSNSCGGPGRGGVV